MKLTHAKCATVGKRAAYVNQIEVRRGGALALRPEWRTARVVGERGRGYGSRRGGTSRQFDKPGDWRTFRDQYILKEEKKKLKSFFFIFYEMTRKFSTQCVPAVRCFVLSFRRRGSSPFSPQFREFILCLFQSETAGKPHARPSSFLRVTYSRAKRFGSNFSPTRHRNPRFVSSAV